MNTRTATRLAWSLWVVCVALISLALLFDFLHAKDILSYPWQIRIHNRVVYPLYAVLTAALSLVYSTIGALIVSRLPRNPIGWIFCGVGLLYQLHTSPWPTPTTPWPNISPCPGANTQPGSRLG